MDHIASFRDLNAYRAARSAAKEIFDVSRGFPRSETYALTDQIRRSARAVSALLAEAWGRRRYPAAFIDKLSQAYGEAKETQAWLDHALDAGYITEDVHAALDAHVDQVAALIYGMAARHESFCRTDVI